MHALDQYFATRRYLDLALRPDGREVAYATDITGNFNVWRQDAEGGWPFQATAFLDRAARRVAWSPDGASLVVAADRDGDEIDQLYLTPASGGAARRLTSRDGVRHLLARRPWSPDGRTLACASDARGGANMD
ncbi:MAG: TolB family protein, partial [Planctomycetota bacterium]